MSLWTLLVVVLVGALEAHGSCPPYQMIYPCTCGVISDKFDKDFAIISCRNIHSEEDLLKILAASKGRNLFEFQLVDSTIRYIPHHAFQQTTFEVLSFENSSINALSDTNVAFSGLENRLRLLEIINCKYVTDWDWTQLSNLSHMMEIVVEHSDLLDVSHGLSTIQNLELEALVFKQNNIEWLDNYVFAPFLLLQRLTLDYNYIEHLERTMFPMPANHLRILGISYNKILTLPHDLFVDMPALSSLYLTGNPIQVIDEKVFQPIWNQIKLFFLYDSPLSCDCRMHWLTNSNNEDKYIHAVCYKPGHLKGKDISSIHTHEIWC